MKKIILVTVTLLLLLTSIACDNKYHVVSEGKNENSFIVSNITKTYTVQFHTNGGTAVNARRVNVIEEAPLTTRKDFLFDGWYLDETFTIGAVFPLEINKDINLYAKWLRIENKVLCEDAAIKMWTDSHSNVYYSINPNGFDLDRLEELGASMTITVNYDVYYEKDYQLNLGYAGSPKYEIGIKDQNDIYIMDKDQSTSKTSKNRTFDVTFSVADLKKKNLTLFFSTDNIQNTIYFENITITYSCLTK